MIAIQRFEQQGAFDEPGVYVIVARKLGDYKLYKYSLDTAL